RSGRLRWSLENRQSRTSWRRRCSVSRHPGWNEGDRESGNRIPRIRAPRHDAETSAGEEEVAMLTITDIMKILPHRYPMLLVDRVLEIDPGKRIVCIKNVTANEQFFQGHFPGAPVMPGVLIVEAMAQCGAVLVLSDIPDRDKKLFLFGGV